LAQQQPEQVQAQGPGSLPERLVPLLVRVLLREPLEQEQLEQLLQGLARQLRLAELRLLVQARLSAREQEQEQRVARLQQSLLVRLRDPLLARREPPGLAEELQVESAVAVCRQGRLRSWLAACSAAWARVVAAVEEAVVEHLRL
jgi:hypothetical protein